jgi:hypothetical protein
MVLRAARLEKLIDLLLSDEAEPGYQNTFFLVYRYFVSAEDLWEIFAERFSVELRVRQVRCVSTRTHMLNFHRIVLVPETVCVSHS